MDNDSKPFRKPASGLRRLLRWFQKPAADSRTDVARLLERTNELTAVAGVRLWEWNLETGRLQFSADCLRRYGEVTTPGSDPLAVLLKIVHPEDRDHVQSEIDKALKGEQPLFMEHRVVHQDGSVHPVQLRGQISRDASGRATRLLGITIDIPDELESLLRIAQQDERQRQLIRRLKLATETAGLSLWELDLITGRLEDDGSFYKVLGLTADDRFMATDGILSEERERVLGPVWSAMADPAHNGIVSIRHRTANPRPEPQYVQTHMRIYRDEQGLAQRMLGVTWDATREVLHATELEKRADEARALTARLSVTTEAAGISPWEFDVTHDRFSWHGRRASYLGLDDVPVEDYWRRLRAIILPEDRAAMEGQAEAALATGRHAYDYTFRVRGIDGKIHHLQNYARVVRDEQGTAQQIVGVSWEITKDILANEQLKRQADEERKLKARLHIATESAGISTWEVDLRAQRFSWVENPLADVRAPVAGLSMFDFRQGVVPEDRYKFADAIAQAVRSGTDRVVINYRVPAREIDSVIHLISYGRLFLGSDGQPSSILGVTWDTSKTVEAEETLREQAEQLRAVERRLERASLSSSEGHWEAELATGHLWYSSSFHTLLGYPPGELPERIETLDYLIHVDEHAQFREALDGHVEHNNALDIEIRLRTQSGQYRWFRLRGMAERDVRAAARMIAGSIHDIHQQKLVEDALGATQRRFERAIHGTQDGLWELELDTDANWYSPRLTQLLGYAPYEMTRGNFQRVLGHPEDTELIDSALRAHYEHNTPFDVEVRLRTSCGKYRWYRARGSAERDINGRPQRLSGSMQDVTEARSAREALVRATEAAQAASRAKSQFLANVSHEIRTPMNGIIGMTGLMLETGLDRTQRDYAETIRSSADSLLTVINDILDFSKIEAGKLDMESIEVDLRANVEDIGSMLAFQAAVKGLELIINLHPDLPESVLGDAQRLRQCITNLVSNAIKFTRRGEIVIEVRPESTSGERRRIRFEVRDTGIGIAADTLPTLFHPFVQADSSTTRHFGGTGLGLSIVRRLVELMGGEVGVRSEAGSGSCFYFSIPVTVVEKTVPQIAIYKPDSGRILLVDDNLTNQRVLGTQLTHAGYEVVTVGSGVVALERLVAAKAAARPFDMVVTDFKMPDMDGLRLGERILDTPGLIDTRLVMLTSLDRHGDTPRLAAIGFAAYLTKPVRTRDLLAAVAKVMGGHPRQWQMDTQPMITRSTLAQEAAQQRFDGRVLLVEDNLVNQKVAARFLERLGCTVDVAHNGAEGVEAAQQRSYDIILMDLQMPVMDGLTATRRIREGERGHTPIVALTANAMNGDRERCEAAGMDGYLTKPIEVERLRGVLRQFGLARDSSGTGELPMLRPLPDDAARPPVDLGAFNELVGGDAEFALELVDTFIRSGEQQLAEILAAVRSNQRAALGKAAHKLKGACANIHARTLQGIAAQLEGTAASADRQSLEEGYGRLREEFKRVRAFLSAPSVLALPKQAAS